MGVLRCIAALLPMPVIVSFGSFVEAVTNRAVIFWAVSYE